jgi:hypothetical protein
MADKLSEWIKEGLSKGYSIDELRKKLSEKGYSRKEIDKALEKKRFPWAITLVIISIIILSISLNSSRLIFPAEKNETKQACIDYYNWECTSYFAKSIESCKGNETCIQLYNLRQALISNDTGICDKMEIRKDYCRNLINKDSKDCEFIGEELKEECIALHSRDAEKCMAIEDPRARGSCLIFATDNKKYCPLMTEKC